jgi:hypothetical protein
LTEQGPGAYTCYKMVANNRIVAAALAYAIGLVPAFGIAWISGVDPLRSVVAPWPAAPIAVLTPFVGAAIGAWLSPRVDAARPFPRWRLVRLLLVGWMIWPVAAVCACVWQGLMRTIAERPPRVEPNERAGPAR